MERCRNGLFFTATALRKVSCRRFINTNCIGCSKGCDILERIISEYIEFFLVSFRLQHTLRICSAYNYNEEEQLYLRRSFIKLRSFFHLGPNSRSPLFRSAFKRGFSKRCQPGNATILHRAL
jgi:hypothetical protein